MQQLNIRSTLVAVLVLLGGVVVSCSSGTLNIVPESCMVHCHDAHNTCVQQCNDDNCKTKCQTVFDDCTLSCTRATSDGGATD